ncbi:hypothetical protein A3F08_02765 [Candidatus Berkelbacteria bacterium RIFCSPHIGHO2_12_FULL_36_9]|uniref:Transposase IS200-like domain-containing protein n=1 Tax=Candidatus Berkelbacteria bacterium RIFCSPHIGHO2_12_FULL_36_9 TaxID=1797469 RepID=A0A1F5EDX6_9BACT|nr:MAG: hypothetical protein A3F08_02765 [Candidatus Berkelbacteria bacterium RIFCSPHIGHO2_12_FULL_36_9]
MVQYRKEILSTGSYYHVYCRSISKYIIFNNNSEFIRMLEILNLYRYIDFNLKYSMFNKLTLLSQSTIIEKLKSDNQVYVEIVAYCIMPTHIHLILKQVADGGISKFMAKVLNSYSRYFNVKHKRVGPLWAGRFKSVLITNDDQMLHLTRYIHLNPSSAKIVELPEDWSFSSYSEYISSKNYFPKICSYENLFMFSAEEYKKFVSDRKSYQQEISKIKHILLEDYAG